MLPDGSAVARINAFLTISRLIRLACERQPEAHFQAARRSGGQFDMAAHGLDQGHAQLEGPDELAALGGGSAVIVAALGASARCSRRITACPRALWWTSAVPSEGHGR
ncbi:hypothetical protein GCM10022214_24520 [Actinomadura miaoliensis]|uniref:Uncharacterized protein n=1 Tax=Actinomadura miaoliensis TaxID=430685 RepID=A0ABP7VK62_9ACTN